MVTMWCCYLQRVANGSQKEAAVVSAGIYFTLLRVPGNMRYTRIYVVEYCETNPTRNEILVKNECD